MEYEKVVAVSVYQKSSRLSSGERKNEIQELKALGKVLGLQVAQIFEQQVENFNPSTFMGSGKLEEIAEFIKLTDTETIIFNNPLKAGIKSNIESILEKISEKPVRLLDRNELIMAIFARHARTSESKIQVELAQLEYLLPRLMGKGTSLSRLGAGIGTRGPGETKLETDRRKIKKRISILKKKLKKINKRRDLSRSGRTGASLVSLIGYTNSGKSTLINNLTVGGAYVEDQVFATLSPVIRKLYLGPAEKVLISDTVGFIKNLPPELIESFKSTLEEIKYSDLLIYLIDISDSNWQQKLQVTKNISQQIIDKIKPSIYVFNKIDLIEDLEKIDLQIRGVVDNPIFISALNNDGLEELKDRVREIIYEE